jgi:hypothetical protein
MSFPRLTLLALPLALGLPLLTAACGAPLAVSAASYGADGASVVETGKTSADHLVSMVSKKDCALWRVFRNQNVCHPYDGDQNPYDVNYNAPFRQGGEGGVEYMQPPHAATDAPVQSWDANAYEAVPTTPANEPADRAAPAASAPAPVQTAALTPDGPTKSSTAVSAKVEKKHPVKGHSATRHKPLRKKPSQDRAASVP